MSSIGQETTSVNRDLYQEVKVIRLLREEVVEERGGSQIHILSSLQRSYS